MSSKRTQSGREAETASVANAGPMCVDWPTDSPSISPNRVSEQDEEATYAAGECREALLRLMPPRLLGRDALSSTTPKWGHPRWLPDSP